jgi:hypothetical protein
MQQAFLKLTSCLILCITISACNKPNINNTFSENRVPEIYPDYTQITLPYNIAPINFIIQESASHYYVEIKSKNGKSIVISTNDASIKIPVSKWAELLKNNKDEVLSLNIFLKKERKWYAYLPIENKISDAAIDPFLMYRFINPANVIWNQMGIYQRNLENFEVSPIMDNSLTDKNCMHCHMVAANNPDNFMLHMRGKPGGTVIYSNKKLKFVNTKTDETLSAGVYPSWHPNGKYIAMSTNKISQKFHAAKEKYAFVYDQTSDIVLYDVEQDLIQNIPALCTNDFENLPSWSPKGNYLYFIYAKNHNPDTSKYQNIRYGLRRIAFDVQTKTWGKIETLIDVEKNEKSVSFPRVSPDNNYVLFSYADYGYFTVYNETSDIALLNLETGEISLPNINSNHVESYPSWSSNGKWILFNSKRDDDLTSRPYFSYFNQGQATKPFMLPQKDAQWNIDEINNINRPELVKGKIPLNPQMLLKLVQNEAKPVTFDMQSKLQIEKTDTSDLEERSHTFDFNQ